MGVDWSGLGGSWLMNDPNSSPQAWFLSTILALVGWRRIFHRGGPNLAEVGGSGWQRLISFHYPSLSLSSIFSLLLSLRRRRFLLSYRPNKYSFLFPFTPLV